MKFFSDCSGSCFDCFLIITIAGHGDDGFYQITETSAKKKLIDRGLQDEPLLEKLKIKFTNLCLNH